MEKKKDNNSSKNVFELLFDDLFGGMKNVCRGIYAVIVIVTTVLALSQCNSYLSAVGNVPLVQPHYQTSPSYDNNEYYENENW